MSSTFTSDALLREFDKTFQMLRHAIYLAPDNKWDVEFGEQTMVGVVYHIIETINYYNQRHHDDWVFGTHLGITKDMEETKRELIWSTKVNKLTKKILNTYLEETKNNLALTLATLDNEQLSEADAFEWFPSRLDKYLYTLRHTMHHLGWVATHINSMNVTKLRWQ